MSKTKWRVEWEDNKYEYHEKDYRVRWLAERRMAKLRRTIGVIGVWLFKVTKGSDCSELSQYIRGDS
jgi:hypothetical protein